MASDQTRGSAKKVTRRREAIATYFSVAQAEPSLWPERCFPFSPHARRVHHASGTEAEAVRTLILVQEYESEVAALRTQVAELRIALSDLEAGHRERLDAIDGQIETLMTVAGVDAELADDSAAEWLRDHSDDLAEYRGNTIAVHPQHGVVAHGSARDVWVEVERRGIAAEVTLEFVPSGEPPAEE